jgi:hypothetical protein|tara:strand:- start:21 stop:419 length:399 start_codon:yes stop_codon:yes gene_type:complete
MNGITLIADNLVKIENIIIIYLDLLYKGDIDLIESVFLQEATVSSVSGGKIISINMDGFRKRIATRQSPESVGETRHDKIIMIDISSPTTAIAKVQCMILKNYYTDYLTFIKVRGKWGIISKVFHKSHSGWT